jgi:DNA modification methylase
MAMIQEALSSVGAGRSIVIDEAGRILAGEGTVRAARANQLRLRVIDTDGDTLIAVRRRNLTPAQKIELALYDNRTAELATWDADVLEQLAAAGTSLGDFWSQDELLGLVGHHDMKAGLTDPDEIPAERATAIRRGDLFELGHHRVLCGDSTNRADVERLLDGHRPLLMVTDPPYGVNYDPAWRAKTGGRNAPALGRVTNDDNADWREAWALFTGAVAYVWHGSTHCATVAQSLQSERFMLRAQIVWVKHRPVMSRGHYHWQHEAALYSVRDGAADDWRFEPEHELAFYGVRDSATAAWEGSHRQSTVWFIEHPKSETGHGTQKPVECMARPMRNHHAPEVYEPFAGSGSSVIAAEQLQRRCFAIEIEPRYCQVVIDRWEAFTGQKARGAKKQRCG